MTAVTDPTDQVLHMKKSKKSIFWIFNFFWIDKLIYSRFCIFLFGQFKILSKILNFIQKSTFWAKAVKTLFKIWKFCLKFEHPIQKPIFLVKNQKKNFTNFWHQKVEILCLTKFLIFYKTMDFRTEFSNFIFFPNFKQNFQILNIILTVFVQGVDFWIKFGIFWIDLKRCIKSRIYKFCNPKKFKRLKCSIKNPLHKNYIKSHDRSPVFFRLNDRLRKNAKMQKIKIKS
mgnify:CR=1 FL=1